MFDHSSEQPVTSGAPNADSSKERRYTPDDQPAFIVGVTGHVDPSDAEGLEQHFRDFFRFLRYGNEPPDDVDGELAKKVKESSARLRQGLAPLVNTRQGRETRNLKASPQDTCDHFFEEWPGLGDLPIVVLSSLAPGVDQIAAKVTLEDEFSNAGFQLQCPLPLPLPLYREASTFKRRPADEASDEKGRQVGARQPEAARGIDSDRSQRR